MKTFRSVVITWGLAAFALCVTPVEAQNLRGSATGPTTAKGYSHPNQFAHLQDVKPADNMYPVVPRGEVAARQPARGWALESGRLT